MEAELLDVTGDDSGKLEARFKKSDGKIYSFPLEKLSPALIGSGPQRRWIDGIG